MKATLANLFPKHTTPTVTLVIDVFRDTTTPKHLYDKRLLRTRTTINVPYHIAHIYADVYIPRFCFRYDLATYTAHKTNYVPNRLGACALFCFPPGQPIGVPLPAPGPSPAEPGRVLFDK